MGAPKGSKYWSFRNKHGRNFKYTPEALWDEAVKYFDWMDQKTWFKNEAIKSGELAGTTMEVPIKTPMSITSFCLFVDIDENTFQRYEKADGYENFWAITKQIKGIIEAQQFEGATVGIFNPNIIARKLGLADKTDITTNGKDIAPSSINVRIIEAADDDE